MRPVRKKDIKRILYGLSFKKTIVFESSPDYTDNSRMVFDEMIRRGLNNKYRMVWRAYDDRPQDCPHEKNTISLPANSRRFKLDLFRAKAIISCNRRIPSCFEGQFSIFLTHGVWFKNCAKFIRIPQGVTSILCTSEQSRAMELPIMEKPENVQVFYAGSPRVDIFQKRKKDLSRVLNTQCSKIVTWYPTFRSKKFNSGRNDGGKHAIPLIYDIDSAKILNEKAKCSDVLIVVKPHPIQDVSKINKMNLSNIKFIDDSFLVSNHISNYEFLNSTDALISDYSTVFLDYLILNRPIGLIWEDIEEYKQNPGLISNYELLASGCEKIYNMEELCKFIEDIGNGSDRLAEQRNIVKKFCHYSYDGKNTERVVDYIIREAQL